MDGKRDSRELSTRMDLVALIESDRGSFDDVRRDESGGSWMGDEDGGWDRENKSGLNDT